MEVPQAAFFCTVISLAHWGHRTRSGQIEGIHRAHTGLKVAYGGHAGGNEQREGFHGAFLKANWGLHEGTQG